MRELLWISPIEALAVVLATVGMYLAMLLFVRILGPRVLSGLSSFDLVAVIAFGSIIGRASLGEIPRLAGGIVALTTLLVLQGLLGIVRRQRWGALAVTSDPILLMADGQVIERHMRRCHVQPGELQSRLRLAGIRHPSEVAAVIFEPTGAVSVLRRGERIDPMLMSGVVGASLLPPDLLSDPA
ncbi:DUF421 domain-containing protein [Georgenia satyanarayanai]|uniref:DUF421 domain-containing protein n=1 Tax=Georgenia satyanarayanai TaxID=860221 RepID=UPI00203A8E7A|nr:YetF domain-containing protein [Georgenia satyanarayanai]MCM3659447.1 DUF421 domain-containing protein [Georgenia satyanarayanai]